MRETIVIGGAVIVIALLAFSHWQAYRAGAVAERSATLNRSVEALRERNTTDDQIRSMDDAGLCRALDGRVSDDGSCI